MCLARIYQRGFLLTLVCWKMCVYSLSRERDELTEDLQAHVRVLMGDTPINLNSPEQLSWVVYSRKVIDKQYWGNAIDPYMNDKTSVAMMAGGYRASVQNESNTVPRV